MLDEKINLEAIKSTKSDVLQTLCAYKGYKVDNDYLSFEKAVNEILYVPFREKNAASQNIAISVKNLSDEGLTEIDFFLGLGKISEVVVKTLDLTLHFHPGKGQKEETYVLEISLKN